jgi:hypothetical protein
MEIKPMSEADKVTLRAMVKEMPADKLRRLTAHLYDIADTRCALGKDVSPEVRGALAKLKNFGYGG